MNLTFTPAELQEALDRALGKAPVPGSLESMIQHRPEDVSWKFRDIEPPAIVYMASEDLVRLSVWTPTAGLAINLSGRYLLPTGELVPFRETRYPTGSGLRETFRIEFPECFLLSAEVDCEAENVQPGELYVNLDIIRGSEGSFVTFGHLIQSPVSSLFHPTWPWSPQIEQFTGPGRLFTLNYGDLGVGNDLAQGVPANRRWKLRGITGLLTTSGTAANRVPYVRFKDPTGAILGAFPAPNTQVAGTAFTYTWAIGTPFRANPLGTFVTASLPDWSLLHVSEVDLLVEAFDASDHWTVVVLYVEDWPETNS